MANRYLASLFLWNYCNLRCPYCFAAPQGIPESWPESIPHTLARLEDFLTGSGLWDLSLCGGEPTIYPEFADFCHRLANAGHRVEFISNGILPFEEIFSAQSVQAVKKVVLSYHTAHENSSRYNEIFTESILYLKKHDISVSVNFPVYPNRKIDALAIKQKFSQLGVQVKLLPFQGEMGGRHFPFEYNQEEKKLIAENGDVTARFLVEHGHYTPTFKPCRAGCEKFYIYVSSGDIYICEQRTEKSLANFLQQDPVETFKKNRFNKPEPCPEKRCVCRHTVVQEAFLKENNRENLANYPEWERISLPLPEAKHHWGQQEKAFADRLMARVKGKKLFVWGGGGHTVFLLETLRRNNFPMDIIQGIIDSSPLKQGRQILGYEVISRQAFEKDHACNCSDIMISSKAFENEIYDDIKKFYGDRFNTIRLYDQSMGVDCNLG